MTSFEYEIRENFTGLEGQAEGYFAVGNSSTTAESTITECLFEIEDTESTVNESCIPLILDEDGAGRRLQARLTQSIEQIPGLVTFGTDAKAGTPSHLAIVSRELAESHSLLAVLCRFPDNLMGYEWAKQSPLNNLHLHFGQLSVQGNVCTIKIDEQVEQLPGVFKH